MIKMKRSADSWIKLMAQLAYAERWLLISTIIGLGAGFFAFAFYMLLHYTEGFVAWILGINSKPFSFLYDIALSAVEHGLRSPLVVGTIVSGAAISALLVYTYAPEAEGHGTDAAISAFHKRAAMISLKVPLIKAFASAATLGFGGSGGVEGPSAQMGAGIGSVLARAMRLPFQARRIALVSGMAAALSVLFRAPIGTALFAVEVLYKRDFEAQAFIPAVIASSIAYAATAPLFHFKPLLPEVHAELPHLYSLRGIIALIILGVFIAPFSLLYVKLFYKVRDATDSLVKKGMSVYLKPIVGGVVAGIVALAFPYVLGPGKGLLAHFLEYGESGNMKHFTLWGMPLWLSLLLIGVAKIVATSFSIGSGGSGGVFAPSILAGAFLGASYGYLIGSKIAPISPVVFAYIGMAAFFGAAAKVPFSTSIMVAEMGRDYLLIVPSLIAAVVARELTGEYSIYESQLRERLRTEIVGAEGLLAIIKSRGLKIDILAKHLANRRIRPVTQDSLLIDAIEDLTRHRTRAVPVVDRDSRVVAVIEESDLPSLLHVIEKEPEITVEYAPLKTPPVVKGDLPIDLVLEEMINYGTDYVIVAENGKYMGVVTVEDVILALSHIVHERIAEFRSK
jgi:CIC family chloride channel protein